MKRKGTVSCFAVLVAACALLSALPASAAVVVNEIYYHPANGSIPPGEDAERLQFLELYNSGAAAVDISGWSFSNGVVFSFPGGTSLAAGGYLVVAKDPAFLQAYGPAIPGGVPVLQWTSGDLDNGGERVTLVDAGLNVVDDVTYDDVGLWPLAADGSGSSLELVNPSYDNAYGLTWRASAGLHGTPGAINSRFSEGPIVLVEAPERGSVVGTLTQVSVTFAEAVTGVVAGDLRVAGSAATSVTGSGAGPYVFTGFTAPTVSPATVLLGPGLIKDLENHAFAGDNWTYALSVPKVVINEIHYNPLATYPNAEFLELYNAEPTAVDISGWRLYEFASPGYTFPAGTSLAAGAYIVVAKDPAQLLAATGFNTPHSWGTGDSLSNGGEPVALANVAGTVVDRVVYVDKNPWPTEPDGSGPSLELKNPALDNSVGGSWAGSLANWGTPGRVNSTFNTVPEVTTVVPARGSVITSLTTVTVNFSETVSGVTADDLIVDGVAASAVSGSGAGPYVFTVTSPTSRVVDVVMTPGGITDATGNPFTGTSWTYYNGSLPAIVINENHYHPADSAVLPGEEPENRQFLELFNNDTATIDLSGWSTGGVVLSIPPGTTLPPGAYLLLAKNAAFLRSKVTIPAGVAVIQWTSGDLSNGGETIGITDKAGNRIDEVTYADGGEWPAEADGGGPSLELIHPAMDNAYSAAWRASLATNGTPGAQNGQYQPNPPPLIFATMHSPVLPTPLQAVTVTTRVLIASAGTPSVTLYYRQDQDPQIAYASVAMLDDGLHGDGAAGDRTFGATVPGLADGQQLDFYITATDGIAISTAPDGHAVLNKYGEPSQTFLCKFTSEVLPTDFPVYHVLVTLANKHHQEALAGEIPRREEFDCTFVDDKGNLWYNLTERYRGQSSIVRLPSSYRIDFPPNRKLQTPMGFSVSILQLNAMFPARQYLGFDLFRRAGIPASKTAWVHVRYPGINYDTCCSGQNGYFGLHLAVEKVDEDFVDSQGGAVTPGRGLDNAGNLYRGQNDGDLRWEGWNKDAYRADANDRNGYTKENNSSADAWDDLIGLCDALNNTPPETYAAHVAEHVDEDNWARFYAIHNLFGNKEGGIYRDTGDDYFIWFNALPGGGEAKKIPWDSDSVMMYDHETIWRTNVNSVRNFLRHNAFAPIYVQALKDVMANEGSVASVGAVIDSMPNGAFASSGGDDWVPYTRQQFKNWLTNQITAFNAEIRDALTLTGVPPSPYTSTNPVIALSGQIDQGGTHNVTVNGLNATFSVYAGTWSHNLTLTPGMNHILVQAWNRTGTEKERQEADVFYNPPGTQHDSLRLIMPTKMYNQKTMTIAADIIDIAGGVNWKVWDAVGTVTLVRLPDRTNVPITTTVFDPHLSDPNGSIRFYNGRGSVSFTLNDGAAVPAGQYELTVTVNAMSIARVFEIESVPLFRTLSGTLSGADLTWGPDEFIHLTGNVTVPGGSTLNIQPGTMVMIDNGPFENGTTIVVNGSLNVAGTQANPVFFFPTNGAAALTLTQSGSAANGDGWRGIDLYGNNTSTFRWFIMTGGGNGVVASHPRPPIIATRGDRPVVDVDYCYFLDNDGMVFSAVTPGRFTIRHSVIQRAGIGAEFQSDGNFLLMEDTWINNCGRAPEANNLDGDILHIDGASSNQTIRRCVLVDGGDDGIDHVASSFTVESTIIHNIRDKAISMTGGHVTMRNSLIFGTGSGIRGEGSVYQTTISTGAPIGTVRALDESIVWPQSPGCDADVAYSDLGSAADATCGTANISQDPRFKGSHDYDLQPGSPALTAGREGDRIGWLGYPFGANCATPADCNDGNACSYDECLAGQCTYTPIANCATCESAGQCDDGNACTTDSCDFGACQHVNNTLTCDDGSACTTADHCAAGICQGTTVTCNDASACTADSCNPASGCVFTPVTCNDANSCTDDSCAAATGCVYTPNNANACTDGVACTNDVCNAGSCVSTSNCAGTLTCNQTTGLCESAPATLTFQQGANGYSGAVDTFLMENEPAAGHGALTYFRWDTDDPPGSTRWEYGLVRFDGIFGPAANQIPQGSTITSATLTVYIENGTVNVGTVNEPTVDWTASSTWNDFGGDAGVQPDEVGPAVANAPTAAGAQVIAVTSSLQSWSANPALNRGWLFVPTGTDGAQASSSEHGTAGQRPLLSVTFTPPAAGCTTNAECSNNLFCDGAETCSNSVCVPGTPPCADAVACTTDACNEATDSCTFTPNDGACGDGDACTTDTCNAVSGCQHAAVSCDDAIACTVDSCSPATGCAHADSCTGGLVCNHANGLCEAPTVPPLPIPAGATWRYFKGGIAPPANWSAIAFDDASWLSGPSGFGYGPDCTATRGTPVDDMLNGYMSLYLRRQFHVASPALVSTLTLVVDYDDAFVVYLNGSEVARRNVTGTPPANTQTATQDHECSTCNGTTCNPAETIDLTAYIGTLVAGTNVIAIQAHNLTLASTDFTILPTLSSTEGGGCTGDPQCSDGNVCNGAETCVAGACQPGTNAAPGTPCGDGVFCNGAETCNGSGACAAGPAPCDDGVPCTADSCDEGSDTCSHALCSMAAAASGSRYVDVTPPAGLASVALRVTGAGLACLPRYVAADGTLTSTPVFRSSADWATARVHAKPIAPDRTYTISAEVVAGTPIASAEARTWLWGDTNNVNGVDMYDMLCVLDGRNGRFTKCTRYGTDLAGDTPDGAVDQADVNAVLNAYGGQPYPDADPCAGVTP